MSVSLSFIVLSSTIQLPYLESLSHHYVMAEDSIDLSDLTDDQQSAVQQYVAVTDQNLAQALPLLKRCEWNVQVQ